MPRFLEDILRSHLPVSATERDMLHRKKCTLNVILINGEEFHLFLF